MPLLKFVGSILELILFPYRQSNSSTTTCCFSVGNTTKGLPFVEFITREYGGNNVSIIWLWDDILVDVEDDEELTDEDDPVLLDEDVDCEDVDCEDVVNDEEESEEEDDWEEDDWEEDDQDDDDREDDDQEEDEGDDDWLEEDPEDIKLS